jgi:hypothetical protein
VQLARERGASTRGAASVSRESHPDLPLKWGRIRVRSERGASTHARERARHPPAANPHPDLPPKWGRIRVQLAAHPRAPAPASTRTREHPRPRAPTPAPARNNKGVGRELIHPIRTATAHPLRIGRGELPAFFVAVVFPVILTAAQIYASII